MPAEPASYSGLRQPVCSVELFQAFLPSLQTEALQAVQVPVPAQAAGFQYIFLHLLSFYLFPLLLQPVLLQNRIHLFLILHPSVLLLLLILLLF